MSSISTNDFAAPRSSETPQSVLAGVWLAGSMIWFGALTAHARQWSSFPSSLGRVPSYWHSDAVDPVIIGFVSLTLWGFGLLALRNTRWLFSTAFVAALAWTGLISYASLRAGTALIGTDLVTRPAEPWKPDTTVSLAGAVLVQRDCTVSHGRGGPTYRPVLDVEVFRPRANPQQPPIMYRLGEFVDLASVKSWTGAAWTVQQALGPPPANTGNLVIAPSSSSPEREACMAHFLPALDGNERDRLTALLLG